MADVNQTLKERGSRYGKFVDHAFVSQSIQDIMVNQYRHAHNKPSDIPWEGLDPDMREGLFMIAHKIGRIINGDPYYADSWVDIAGYAQLVANRLEEAEKKQA